MRNDRYAGGGGFNPAMLGAAVAINAALLAGLILSGQIAAIIPPRPHPDTIVRLIPLADPPPPEPQPRTDPTPTTPREIFVPTPKVPVATDPDVTLTTTEVAPPPPQPPVGSGGTGVTVDPVPPPLPALVDAQPDPRYAADFQPDYPAAELRAERSGRVSVRVLIGVDGRVQDVQRLSASSDAFFDATRRRALTRWRFRPATRGGVPEPAWRTMSVNFVLEDAR